MNARARTCALVLTSCFTLAVPASALAAVDVNTASASELETLPGIGPSKATAILEYRAAHGAFSRPSDLQKVSGIGPATYANLAALITVGEASPAAAQPVAVPPQETSDPAPPVPSGFDLMENGTTTAFADVPFRFAASAPAGSSLVWNFGDGSTGTGNPTEKLYRYPGVYRVEAYASGAAAQGMTVHVIRASVRIVSVTGEGITLENDDAAELDISGWRLSAGTVFFRFPRGSVLLAGDPVLFSSSITGLPVSFDAYLSYPDGIIAARYEPVQPALPSAGSHTMKSVESITSVSHPTHAQEIVSAPRGTDGVPIPRGAAVAATATDPAAFASALSADATEATVPGVLAGLTPSSWLIGALSILTVAGGALLIL